MMRLDAVAAERAWQYTFYVLCGCILFFLVSPLIAIIPLSFSSDRMFTYPLPGFSLQWYKEFFYSPAWRLAIKNTLIVACSVVILATSLGTLASLGLNMAKFRFKGAIIGVLLSPMMVPHIIVGVGMFFFYSSLKLLNSLCGLILAHTACATPFVVMTVTVTLSNFNLNYMRAAASLGAGPVTTFFKVVLPLILPGVISGGVLAFVTSFDELIIAILLVGSDQRTLPRQMWSGVREEITLTITAVATVLIVFSVLMLLIMEMLRRRSERMQGTGR